METSADQTPEPSIEILRALANPARWRTYESLRLLGPMTGRAVSRVIDISEASALQHLKTLGEVGFAQPAVGQDAPTPRLRVWEAVPGGVRIASDFTWGRSELAPAAALWFRAALAAQAEIISRWIDIAPSWPERWAAAAENYDYYLWLDVGELEELRADLHAVWARWQQVSDHHQRQGSAQARPIVLITHAVPYPLQFTPS